MGKVNEPHFHDYFANLYGKRWPDLYGALRLPSHHEAITEDLLQPYYMDAASRAVAQLLPLAGAERILDLCAAPGGKTLLTATSMDAAAHLTANERSAARRARLRKVIDQHLPEPVRARVTVTPHDARRWGMYERDTYDAVLADVPCSSERHLVHAAGEKEPTWNPRRSKRLAVDQFAILAAGIDACRPGGCILYATCALNAIENDAVVARALTRRSRERRPVDVVTIEPASLSVAGGSSTVHGVLILPDRSGGAGPMYAALLQKRAAIG